MKIIIVDDSKLLRERLKEILLEINNVQIVGEASNGNDALNLITSRESDLIILDIRMPEMNGIELLRKIKNFKNKPEVCVYTNYPYLQYKNACIAEGADYFIDKNQDVQAIKGLVINMQKKYAENDKT